MGGCDPADCQIAQGRQAKGSQVGGVEEARNIHNHEKDEDKSSKSCAEVSCLHRDVVKQGSTIEIGLAAKCSIDAVSDNRVFN